MNTSDTARRWRHATFLAAYCVLVALVAASCRGTDEIGAADGEPASADGRPADPVPGGRLVVGVPAESNGWNPFMNQWSDSGTMVGTSIIEPLAVQDNAGRAQPWLAERWEPNADFTQWTITLRPGIVFHDNTPLDAEAAKRSIEESYTTGLYEVALRPLYDRVEVTGPLTVKVFLKTRWAQYPTSLANQWILAPSMLDREDKGTSDPVGTGPFRFDRWVPGRSLAARRFDRYWRRDSRSQQLPYLNEIEFRPIVEDAERQRAIRTGEIDVALSAAGDIAVDLEDDFNVIKDYTGQRTFLMLNTAVGKGNDGNPFVNVHARRALAHATDRRRVADSVGTDVQTTPFGYRPDSPWAPEGDHGYPDYDPDKAREEIEKYKKATGARSLSFTLNGINAFEVEATMQSLKEMWAEVGIKADLNAMEASQLTILSAMGHYQASWFRLHDFPDPDQMFFYLTEDNINPVDELALNFTRYTTKQLQSNLRVVRDSLDHAERKKASDEIIKETNEQVINLWLYDTPASLVSRRKVRGLDGFRSHSFMNNLPKPWLAEAWLER